MFSNSNSLNSISNDTTYVEIPITIPSLVTVSFDTTITDVAGSKTFWVKNNNNKAIDFSSLRTLSSNFYFTTSNFNLNPSDSILMTVYFNTPQNVTYNDFMLFEGYGLKNSLIFKVIGTAKHSDTLYRITQNLYDDTLKGALRYITTNGYNQLGYNTKARDSLYAVIDDWYNVDTIECLYTATRGYVTNRTDATNFGFQTDHTFPQSMFGSDEPEQSDLYHLMPMIGAANTRKSNNPFGVVTQNLLWDSAGSKLGKDVDSISVWEPRNFAKGKVARSMFYIMTKYGNSGNYVDLKTENLFRNWDTLYVKDNPDSIRSARIKSMQLVPQPFIEHPAFSKRIYSFYSTGSKPKVPMIGVSPSNLTFDTIYSGRTSGFLLSIINYGDTTLIIDSMKSNNAQIVVDSVTTSIPKGEVRYSRLKFKPISPTTDYSALITVYSNIGTFIINAKGRSI